MRCFNCNFIHLPELNDMRTIAESICPQCGHDHSEVAFGPMTPIIKQIFYENPNKDLRGYLDTTKALLYEFKRNPFSQLSQLSSST